MIDNEEAARVMLPAPVLEEQEVSKTPGVKGRRPTSKGTPIMAKTSKSPKCWYLFHEFFSNSIL